MHYKKILLMLFFTFCLCVKIVQAQKITFREDFDNPTVSLSSIPVNGWRQTQDYCVSPSKSYWAMVPNVVGEEVVLTSPVYDFSNYYHVYLEFKHICKISPTDEARVEYKISGQTWLPIPTNAYRGTSAFYSLRGFSASANPKWEPNDSLAIPEHSWWTSEKFDLSFETGYEPQVQFRFVVKKGTTPGTQISYGWLLDDVEITASSADLTPLQITLLYPYPSGTVHHVGIYEIKANIESSASAPIVRAWLRYSVLREGVLVDADSIAMTAYIGNTHWKATLPQFVFGSEVIYTITAQNTSNNSATIMDGYAIKPDPELVYDSIAVSLKDFVSPIAKQVISATTTPVVVTLYNPGQADLSELTIYWKINSVLQPPVLWTGNLPQDFSITITLGNYTAGTNAYDTITAWAVLPEGVLDSSPKDDTVCVTPYGCTGGIIGTYTIGNGGNLPNWNQFLDLLGKCSPIGDITVAFLSGNYNQMINLNNMNNLMNGHHLRVTSLTGNAQDVVIRAGVVGVFLSNTDHVTIDGLTIDAREQISNAYAFNFGGNCNHITIRDCIILGDSTTSAPSIRLIYKSGSVGVVNHLKIINNRIDGGYYGIYFYGATNNNAYGSNITVDSNTIVNTIYAMEFQYVDFTRIAHNVLSSRLSANNFNGIYTHSCNGDIVNNRILRRGTLATVAIGISLATHNYYHTQRHALIANNEIIAGGNAGSCRGISLNLGNYDLIHNSIYVSGAYASRGIMVNYDINAKIKYNNIVMTHSASYPIYLQEVVSLARYDIDHNNFFAPQYIGFAEINYTDIAAWQTMIASDTRSFALNPSFIDVSRSLKLSDYTGFRCLPVPGVEIDIDSVSRAGITNIGCYQGGVSPTDLSLGSLIGWRKGATITTNDTLKAIILNCGESEIDTVVIHWTINEVAQTPVLAKINLKKGEMDTITLGIINYPIGEMEIKAYIAGLGSLNDDYKDNDTAVVHAYTCSSYFGGDYTVGATGDFSSLSEAIDKLRACGAMADVNLLIESGRYVENIQLANLLGATNGYKVRLVSQTGNPADVVFTSPDYCFTLKDVRDVIIQAITIDMSGAVGFHNAIRFRGGCSHILIRDCHIIGDTVGNTSAMLIEKSDPNVADSIFFINNVINGGSYGVFFSYGRNMIIDSNTFCNARNVGMAFEDIEFSSLSYNEVISRSPSAAYWDGITLYESKGDAIGNRIYAKGNNAFCFSIYYQNWNNNAAPALIANNELIFSDGVGIYLDHANAQLLYNSIHGNGGGTGVRITNATSDLKIKYNNIVTNGVAGIPIYIEPATPWIGWDIDYNNMYAPQSAGKVGTVDCATIPQWQTVVSSDTRSFNLLPQYIDASQSLELSDYGGFIAPFSPQVSRDVKGNVRPAVTSVGAYHGLLNNVDAVLKELLGLRSREIIAGEGQFDILKAVVTNHGLEVLDTIVFHWTLNNVAQVPKIWTGGLLPGATDTIVVGGVYYTAAGELAVKTWIASLGDKVDGNTGNDTATLNRTICPHALTGTIVIGNGALCDFATIDHALAALVTCGASADITFAFETGNYTQTIDLTDLENYINGYRFTLTSLSGNAADVLIEASNSGIILNNSHRVTIKGLTVDVSAVVTGGYGIIFTGACSDVMIRDCHILANRVNSGTNFAIRKGNNTGVANHISFIKNVINGGYSNVEFYGGTSANYGSNIVFDSNTISNGYIYGVHCYYVDFKSVSHNMITPRSSMSGYYWRGLNFNSCNGNLLNNRIRQRRDNVITESYGIQLSYHNRYNTQDTALIANNEIVLSGKNTSYGMVVDNTHAHIFYNSIYVDNLSAARGMQINDNASYLKIKYNNIVVNEPYSYPIFMLGTNYLLYWDIDYNNLYAPQYMGYASGQRTNIASWQSMVLSDKNSVSVFPSYIDILTSLKMLANDSLKCPLQAGINNDLEGRYRFSVTRMGAYTFAFYDFDMALHNIIHPHAVLNQDFAVTVEAINFGVANIDNAVLSWSKNGVYQGSTAWSALVPMLSGDTRVISLGHFIFDGLETEVKIWIDSVNNELDTLNWNDTVSATLTQVPLAWFTEPFVVDTIDKREFDVHAVIIEGSGALPNAALPRLCVRTYLGAQIIYDTLFMTFADGKWSAHVPPQYYGSKVVYSLHLSDTMNNAITLTDSTHIRFRNGSGSLYATPNLTLSTLYGLDFGNTGCLPDDIPLSVEVINTGNRAIIFSQDSLSISLRVMQPLLFSLDTVIRVGSLSIGDRMEVKLTDHFPILTAGRYDISVYQALSGDTVTIDDTLNYTYISGRFGLPVDENFSKGRMDVVFNSVAHVGNSIWRVMSQGSGADADVTPIFGDGILAFNGSAGSIARLYTHQLDLSQTVQPNLSFWYFHDTTPSLDYMDVRVTIDGGATYTTLISLSKQDEERGWRQYSMNLPSFAVNQCVFILFEAMEKDRAGQTWQYIDRIRITAKQDLAITAIYVDTNACDMDNKDWKIVLSNLTDPAIDYSLMPIKLFLEVDPSGQTYATTVSHGVLNGFCSDTITISAGINLSNQTYRLMAYFESIHDNNRDNDTLYHTFVFNPHLHIEAQNKTDDINCLGAGAQEIQIVTIVNDGNMVMEDVVIVLETHNSQAFLTAIYDTLPTALHPGQTLVHTMTQPYIVPDEDFYVNIFAILTCGKFYSDSVFLSECVEELSVIDRIDEGMSLSQNIPNPAFGNTKINYRIPADGRVIFNIYSVSGQSLFTKSIESVSGVGRVDFDVTTLATGIYYYSMTYNGQTLVKKMNVQR